jgi:hypothetical protein
LRAEPEQFHGIGRNQGSQPRIAGSDAIDQDAFPPQRGTRSGEPRSRRPLRADAGEPYRLEVTGLRGEPLPAALRPSNMRQVSQSPAIARRRTVLLGPRTLPGRNPCDMLRDVRRFSPGLSARVCMDPPRITAVAQLLNRRRPRGLRGPIVSDRTDAVEGVSWSR